MVERTDGLDWLDLIGVHSWCRLASLQCSAVVRRRAFALAQGGRTRLRAREFSSSPHITSLCCVAWPAAAPGTRGRSCPPVWLAGWEVKFRVLYVIHYVPYGMQMRRGLSLCYGMVIGHATAYTVNLWHCSRRAAIDCARDWQADLIAPLPRLSWCSLFLDIRNLAGAKLPPRLRGTVDQAPTPANVPPARHILS